MWNFDNPNGNRKFILKLGISKEQQYYNGYLFHFATVSIEVYQSIKWGDTTNYTSKNREFVP